jgi:ABC-type nitrate/sulfonate/bicarbonate transport system permease component
LLFDSADLALFDFALFDFVSFAVAPFAVAPFDFALFDFAVVFAVALRSVFPFVFPTVDGLRRCADTSTTFSTSRSKLKRSTVAPAEATW